MFVYSILLGPTGTLPWSQTSWTVLMRKLIHTSTFFLVLLMVPEIKIGPVHVPIISNSFKPVCLFVCFLDWNASLPVYHVISCEHCQLNYPVISKKTLSLNINWLHFSAWIHKKAKTKKKWNCLVNCVIHKNNSLLKYKK